MIQIRVQNSSSKWYSFIRRAPRWRWTVSQYFLYSPFFLLSLLLKILSFLLAKGKLTIHFPDSDTYKHLPSFSENVLLWITKSDHSSQTSKLCNDRNDRCHASVYLPASFHTSLKPFYLSLLSGIAPLLLGFLQLYAPFWLFHGENHSSFHTFVKLRKRRNIRFWNFFTVVGF